MEYTRKRVYKMTVSSLNQNAKMNPWEHHPSEEITSETSEALSVPAWCHPSLVCRRNGLLECCSFLCFLLLFCLNNIYFSFPQF